MKKFLKKYYLVFVFIILVVLVSALFNSKNANFNSVASILSAQQLLAQNRGQLSNLSMQQKEDLIKKIDAESQSIAGSHNTLNREAFALKDERTKLNQEIQKINSDTASVNAQISAANTRINSLKASQQSTNQRHKDKSRQCNRLKGPQLQNCRSQLKVISNSLNSIKNQVAQAQNSLTPLTQRLSPFQNSLSQVNSRISLLNTQISAKEMEFRKIDSVLSALRDFRKEVVDSTSGPKDEDQPISGCTDGMASNWNSMATVDDGSCEYKEEGEGCTDSAAKNYDPDATIDDGSCYYDSCMCEVDENGENEESEVEKITKVSVKVTWFGGSGDPNMSADEPLFVAGKMARDLNPDDMYTAWPMPDVNKDNLDSPLKLPNMEDCFGPEKDSWKGERITRANEALSEDYDAEISVTDANGNKKTITIPIVDRGPADRNRWDMSKGALRALGLEKQMNDGPSKSDAVELEVRLVPKNGGSCPATD
jgi:peptidoglycan hydrolase CwlO-like protein